MIFDWLRGLLVVRAGRLLGTAAGVALTVALLAVLSSFMQQSAAEMTSVAVSTVPVDWQVQLVPGADPATIAAAAADAAPGDPDGSTIDADGYLWSTRWGAGQVVRFAPDGSVDRVLTLPAPQPTCPAFGGPDLDVLYVTSATVGLRADQLADAPKSGGVFAKKVTIKGLAEVRFAGRRR